VNSSTHRFRKLGAALLLSVCTCGAAAAPRVSVRDSAAFTVIDVPAPPLGLVETAVRLTPMSSTQASTGTYRHAGAEYCVVIAGSVTRWEDGQTRDVAAGAAFASPAGGTSASSATQPAVFICAALTPQDAGSGCGANATPAPPVTSIFHNLFTLDAVPATPFTLVEQLVDLPPGSSTVPFAYGARAYLTVANGSVTLKRGGAMSHYQLGSPFAVERGQPIRLMNQTNRLASVTVVLLLPETVRFTEPPNAY